MELKPPTPETDQELLNLEKEDLSPEEKFDRMTQFARELESRLNGSHFLNMVKEGSVIRNRWGDVVTIKHIDVLERTVSIDNNSEGIAGLRVVSFKQFSEMLDFALRTQGAEIDKPVEGHYTIKDVL